MFLSPAFLSTVIWKDWPKFLTQLVTLVESEVRQFGYPQEKEIANVLLNYRLNLLRIFEILCDYKNGICY